MDEENHTENKIIIATDAKQLSTLEEKWYSRWREAAAWVFLTVVLFDFIVAPIGHAVFALILHLPDTPWTPLTLQGGAMFYMCFMAILGISAWGKSQERQGIISNLPDYSNAPKQS